ncbi:hypothetical protein AADZ91_04950 [Colwelliaceae bacterium 6441]
MKYLFFFLFYPVLLGTALAKTEIVWMTDDKRDLQELLLERHNSIGLDTINLVLNNLQAYKIELQYASLSRIDRELQTKKNACVGNRLKTSERLKDNLFSLPVNIHPSLRLYYLKDNIRLPKSILNSQQQLISLNALFEHFPDKIIGKEKNRSFGPLIDKQLSTIDHSNIANHVGVNRYNAISRLFF